MKSIFSVMSLVAMFLGTSASVARAENEVAHFETPDFVGNSIFPSGRAVVFGVAQAEHSDVVLLDNGYDQGFRNGMECEVFRSGNLIGVIVLVEVRTDRAAGLILSLEENQGIRYNDIVRIKTQQI